MAKVISIRNLITAAPPSSTTVGVAYGFENIVVASLDGGNTWTLKHQEIGASSNLLASASDGISKIVVVGGDISGSVENSIISSVDGGSTWVARSLGTLTGNSLVLNGIIFDGSKFVVAGKNNTAGGTPVIGTSIDAINWIWSVPSGITQPLNDIAFFNGLYIVIEDINGSGISHIWSSPDLSTWTLRFTSTGSIAWGFFFSRPGHIFVTPTQGDFRGAYSSDGMSWTDTGTENSVNILNRFNIVFDPIHNHWVANTDAAGSNTGNLGQGGLFYSSDDGASFHTGHAPAFNASDVVIFGSSVFGFDNNLYANYGYTPAASGSLQKSTDGGVTWTDLHDYVNQIVQSIRSVGSQFIAWLAPTNFSIEHIVTSPDLLTFTNVFTDTNADVNIIDFFTLTS